MHNKLLLLSVLIVCLWILMSLFANSARLSPDQIMLEKILSAPGTESVLGHDDLGRSVAARLIAGARTSLTVAIIVVCISSILGTMIGVVSAWCGGWYDKCTLVLIDIFMAFPGLLLAIALAGVLGPGLSNAVIALSVVGWVSFARLARAQTLSVRQRDHVLAARALGSREYRILLQHILPLILAPLIVLATFELAAVVIAEATLSFLGLGVQAPAASWGGMIRDGVRYMLVAPHVVLTPGIAVFLVVVAVNIIGDHLRDYFDVRSARLAARQ